MGRVIGSGLVAVVLGVFTVAAAQLPPDIMADRYLLQVERLIGEKDHEGALEVMNKIIALQQEHHLTVPVEFHFKYAQIAFSAGSIKVAVDSVNQYLATAGRKGQFYRQALELLVEAEEKLREAEAKRKRIRAEWRRIEAIQKENTDQPKRQIEAAARLLPRDKLLSGGLGPEMVRIAAGRFQYYRSQGSMVSNLQWVDVNRPFAIGKYEVTRGEFEKFVRSTRYRTEARQDPKYGCELEIVHTLGWGRRKTSDRVSRNKLRWNRPGFDQTAIHPVTCVSTRDAMEYVKWLSQETGQSYRIPSAAEWQYAARAGSNAAMLFVTPEDDPNPCRKGNIWAADGAESYGYDCSDGALYTAAVGQFPPNDVGLHDMVGNVSELVLECASSPDPLGEDFRFLYLSANGSAKQPDGCNEFVVALGSSWNTTVNDRWDYREWKNLPVKPYQYGHPETHGWVYYKKNSSISIGFRIVRDLQNDDSAPK